MIQIKPFFAAVALLSMPIVAAGQTEEAAAEETRDAIAKADPADMPNETQAYPEDEASDFFENELPNEVHVPVADFPLDENPLDDKEALADADETNIQPAAEIEYTEEALQVEFARYRALLAEGTLDEADNVAKRIVEMSIKVYGPRARETASALNNLGIVQHSNRQFDAAIQNFQSAVEIIESVENKLSDGLVNPLKGLGAAQLANGSPRSANTTFQRAAHITHVNEGPHNIEQTEILQSIAEVQLRMGDTKRAREVLDQIHILNVRFFEQDPMGLIPSLMNRASWQHRAGYFNEERATYRRAIRIVESGTDDDEHPLLLEPLRRLGESYYFTDVSEAAQQSVGLITSGEAYFKRAVRIVEDSENIGWQDFANTKLALADYYTFSESQNRARKLYAEIWEYLSADEERIAYREQLLSEPSVTRGESLPNYVGTSATPVLGSGSLTGRIIVNYTVSSRGRVRDINTSAEPEEFTAIQRMVHREIQQRVFRPKIVDGAPVTSTNQVFEHRFSYSQADLDELKAKSKSSGNANTASR